MAVTVVPDGRVTPTGVRALAVAPLPSWPELLRPQASTWPFDVRARLWFAPAATAVTVVPEGRLTATGVLLLGQVPQPSSPRLFRPQAQTLPVDVTARPVSYTHLT